MLPLLGAGPLQGPPILITQQEQTAFPAAGLPDDIRVVPASPRLLRIGRYNRSGPPILLTQQKQTAFPAESAVFDARCAIPPPRLMGLGVSMGGPPILVTQMAYAPIEAIKAVDTPITHPLVKFRIGRRGPAVITQQTQSQAGPLTFVISSPIPGGTLATTATLIRALSTAVSGVLTIGGTLARSMTQAIDGALTTAGVLKRGAQIVRGGVLATASAIARAVSAKIGGVLDTASALSTGKVAQRSVGGSLSVAGTLATKEIDKPVVLLPPVFASPSSNTSVRVTDVPWDGVTHGKGDIGI